MSNRSLPLPSEQGWKDTADLSAGEVIRILVRWTPSDIPNIRNHSWAGRTFMTSTPRKAIMCGTVICSTMKTMR